jgi:hypothetical protein
MLPRRRPKKVNQEIRSVAMLPFRTWTAAPAKNAAALRLEEGRLRVSGVSLAQRALIGVRVPAGRRHGLWTTIAVTARD